MIEVWKGGKFEHDHEIDAQKKIVSVCHNFFKEEMAYLVFSFTIQNADFDCVIFTKNKIIIVELKKIDKGFISGSENGHWINIQSSGYEREIIRNKNPFQQCSICRSILNKQLRIYYQNLKTQDIGRYIDSGIIAYPEGEPKNDGQIEKVVHNNPWFYYEKLDSFKVSVLSSRIEEKLPTKFPNVDDFIRRHLNCQKDAYNVVETKRSKYEINKETSACVEAELKQNSLVVAGPGSGKTKYIVERIKYLVNEKKILPQNIGFVTFTNESSNEIKIRLHRELSLSEKNTFYCRGTIHRLCLLLLENIDGFRKLGYIDKPTVLSASETKDRIIHYYQNATELSEEFLLKIAELYCLSINRLIYSDDQLITKYLSDLGFPQIISLNDTNANWFKSNFKKYLSEQMKENVIDFDSILFHTYELLSDSSTPKLISSNLKYLFVDELQDISKIQFGIFKKLSIAGTRINAVGDPAQAIYAFRGGDSHAFNWFAQELDSAKIFNLSKNYRSSINIVETSEFFKEQFQLYPNKYISIKCIPAKNEPGEIKFLNFENEVDEAVGIAKEIQKIINNNNDLSYSEIAILYRNVNQLNQNIGPVFNQFEIPYFYNHKNKFIDKSIISRILKVLNCVYSSKLSLSDLFFIYNSSPFNSILTYNKFVKPITNEVLQSNRIIDDDGVDKIMSALDSLNLSNLQERKEIDYFKDVLSMRANIKEPLNENILYYYSEIYPKTKTIKDNLCDSSNEEDVDRMLDIASDYGSDYRSFLKKLKFEFVEDDSSQGVNISTIHGAKGREWHTVFLPNLGDSSFKFQKEDQLESQEDNIFYVAITRPKSKLYLTYSEVCKFEKVQPSTCFNMLNEYYEANYL